MPLNAALKSKYIPLSLTLVAEWICAIKENHDEETKPPELKNPATWVMKETGHLISYI